MAALFAAITLEATAVAVASLHGRNEIPVETGILSEPPAAEGIILDLPPELPAAIEEPQFAPPLLPLDPTEFVIEEPSRPARKQNPPVHKSRISPAGTASAATGSPTLTSRHARMISAPRPTYPYEARRAKQTGSGRFLLEFDPSGSVTNVHLVQSTGSRLLDQVSIRTLSRRKCNPGLYKQVYVPITFSLEGATL